MKIKTLSLLFLLIASAHAQYAPSASGSTTAAAEMNSKLSHNEQASAPATCVQGKDQYTNTVSGKIFDCTATNTWTERIIATQTYNNPAWITGGVLKAGFSAGGSALSAASACGIAQNSGTISQITLLSDGTVGNATIDVRSESVAQYLAGTSPTSMTNGNPVSFTGARGVQVSSFTGWTSTTITAGTVYCFVLSAPSSILTLSVGVKY